jgi:predicted dehydrogenase
MQASAERNGRHVMVGMKKMFFPANEKAKELMDGEDFGPVALATLQYPQFIPSVEEFGRYKTGEACGAVTGFLDHLVHPASLMIYLLGMPQSLYYERSASGAGLATFAFPSGAVASLAMTQGAANNGGMERTLIVSSKGRHIIVENNIRVSYVRSAPVGYGDTPSFYAGTPQDATAATWEPEFSLGQLYNKGLFLLGYYNEVNEFARAVLEGRAPRKGTLEQAWQVTRIFEAFGEGPGKVIRF